MQKWGSRSIFNSVSVCLNFTGFGLLLWASGSDVVVQLLSCAWLFATLWTAACQASLSYTISWSVSNSYPLSWWCHPTVSSSVTPSPPALHLSQHQGLFQWVSSLYQVAKVLELQHQSFQWIFRVDFLQEWFDLLAVQGLSRIFSSTTVQNHQFFSTQPSLWSNSHTGMWLLEKT